METKIILLPAIAAVVGYVLLRNRRSSQLAYIDSFKFHPMLARKVKEKYPHLSDSEIKMVFDALRDYFHICNVAGKQMVAMPSQVVDVAWHEFILSTRSYKDFCQKAIGRFLHHTPTEVMKTPTRAQESIKRAWRLSCDKEGIYPATPARLPRLFAIDALLNIEDGYHYSLNCHDKSSPMYGSGYCAGDIGCTSGCAGDSGASDAATGSGPGSSCSGSSCGGGCGGD